MRKATKKNERVCIQCNRNGHAVLLWHWHHGTFCVECIGKMMGIVRDFVGVERAGQTGFAEDITTFKADGSRMPARKAAKS